MKHFSLAISLIVIATAGRAQTDSYLKKNWKKILITDYLNAANGYNNYYVINRSDRILRNVGYQDSAIRVIPQSHIDQLFSATKPLNKGSDMFEVNGLDSTWFLNNLTTFWADFVDHWMIEDTALTNAFSLNILRDYSKTQPFLAFPEFIKDGSHRVEVSIILNKDTLILISASNSWTRQPWLINDNLSYSFELGESIARLLPDNPNGHHDALTRKHYIRSVFREVYKKHIELPSEIIKLEKKYPTQTKVIKEHFKIIDCWMYEDKGISSDYPKSAVVLELIEHNTKDNIIFSARFKSKNKLYPIEQFLNNKKDILKQFKTNNPIYRYALENKNAVCSIKIVNNQSFDRKKRKRLLKEIKQNNPEVKQYKRELLNAISFNLKEKQAEKSSYSNWLILPDGTLILRHLHGEFLMNFSKKFVKEKQGSDFTIVKFNDL